MNKHKVVIKKTDKVTHNVRRFVVDRPTGYSFEPGQATDISIPASELENELRPFTFTSLTEANYLEFIIKIYKDHHGVTEKLGELKDGDKLILHDVFGYIKYEGPGLFIAGGAGITPFIAILRHLKKENKLAGNTLIFANRAEEDIILYDELKEMLGERFINVLEITENPQFKKGFIGSGLLKQQINEPGQFFYICGPEKFTAIMVDNLAQLGISKEKIILEK